MIGILILVGVATLIYYLAIKPYSYWANKNVPTGKITPLFGDNLNMILGKENFADVMESMYNKIPNTRFIGVYQFQAPSLLIKSPQLIKQILVKDFDHFVNRRNFIPDGVDELLTKNLSALKGQIWKNMRSKVSPSFTSSKMRMMFILICQNAQSFVEHFLKKNEDIVEVDLKDAISRYSNDVIASVAFGIEVDSLGEKENDFYMMGKQAANFTSIWLKLKFLLYQFCPNVAATFKISIISNKVKNYFMSIVRDTIQMREDQNIKRPDMLGLLIEGRSNKQKENTVEEIKETSFAAVQEHIEMSQTATDLSDTDIASQLFVFFIAGFETVSLAMCFLAQELMENPDIQRKLIEEIDEKRPKEGTPSYETVVNMTYLDMVVSELLRKWPVGVLAERLVTKPYTIQPELPNEKPVHLEVNDSVMIPIYAIHRDPQYYSDPEKFDPERFSPENKHSIDPFTYLPFGAGPRNCIASRFALLEIKAVFFYLLSNFEIVPTEKSSIPLKISKSAFAITPVNGFHIGLKKRNQKK